MFGRQQKRSQKFTVLFAINSEYFRGDLEILANDETFSIMPMPVYWQWQLINTFYPQSVQRDPFSVQKWAKAQNHGDVYHPSQLFQVFLFAFLPKLYRALDCDCLIHGNFRHLCDLDWLKVNQDIGFASILIFRESLLLSRRVYLRVRDRTKDFGFSFGSHLIAHNQNVASAFIESGIFPEDNVSVCGNLRFDIFARQITQKSRHPSPDSIRKLVVLFYPPRFDPRFDTPEYRRLHDDTIATLVQLAGDHTGVDFVIKPKSEHIAGYKIGGRGTDLEQLIAEVTPPDQPLTNLTIQPNANVHKLIIRSDITIGFYSSVLFEAALAKKAVLLPLYDYFFSTIDKTTYPLTPYLELFEIAKTPTSLADLVTKRLSGYTIAEAVQKKRTQLFSEFLSPIDGNVLNRTTATILDIVKARRKG